VLIGLLIFANRPSDGLALRPPSDPTPIELADGRAIGREDAPATMEVWADFQCPSCGIFSRSTEPRLIRDYVAPGRLRIVFRDFAFIGNESTAAAIAARAAESQGKFWPYHDWLFANQSGENKGAFRREILIAIASEIGLDVSAFEADLDDVSLADAVRAETATGSRIPVSVTPTLIIGDQVIKGVPAWEDLSAAVDAEIARSSGGQTAP
jgi:protein-disulfide isomerase